MKENLNGTGTWFKTHFIIFNMKKICFILWSIFVLFYSCEEPEPVAGFEDVEEMTIYDYLIENQDQFSSFTSILQKGGLDKTLSAYNPYGIKYSLFLPDNEGIQKFIDENEYIASLDEILSDPDYAIAFGRYHILNRGIHSNNFPFGAFPEPTLSDDYLTVSFIIEPDTSYYKINNQAAVIHPNIEVSNGFIHIIEKALTPVSFTSYHWLEMNEDYSIFKAAVDLTGLKPHLDINIKSDLTVQPVTLLLESNQVFHQFDIHSVEDLATHISPGQDNYTSELNPLYNFVAYHILPGRYFIDDFEGVSSNYTTFSDIPVNINGLGIDFAINKGKEIFDTLIVQGDTTFIDYVGFNYDDSNILSQSGVIHMINRLMRQHSPSRSIQTYQFNEEYAFSEFRSKPGTHLVEEELNLKYITWKGIDLYFVELGDQESSAWGADYLEMNGDFEISYQIPSLVQGKYEMYLGAECFNVQNAVVEIYVDGKKVGGFIDLTKGGSAGTPFRRILLGTVDFKTYSSHKITVKSLIPGRFLWDYIRFEPI
jgi:uncharacterized surface protein with fasciclin (FAS1) repeats